MTAWTTEPSYIVGQLQEGGIRDVGTETTAGLALGPSHGAVPALQIDRFNKLVADRVAKGRARSLDPNYVEEIFRIVHEASLNEQLDMMAPEGE